MYALCVIFLHRACKCTEPGVWRAVAAATRRNGGLNVQRRSARQALQCYCVRKHVIYIMSECCLYANKLDCSHGHVEHHSGVNACMCVAHFGNEWQCTSKNHWFKTDLAHECSLSLLACACEVHVSTFLLLVGMVSQRCQLARNPVC